MLKKTAYSNDNARLGKIVKIENVKEKDSQIEKTLIYIQKNFLLRTSLKIILEAKLIASVENGKVIINITKKEFDTVVNQALAQRKQMISSAKMREASALDKASGVAFSWGKI